MGLRIDIYSKSLEKSIGAPWKTPNIGILGDFSSEIGLPDSIFGCFSKAVQCVDLCQLFTNIEIPKKQNLEVVTGDTILILGPKPPKNAKNGLFWTFLTAFLPFWHYFFECWASFQTLDQLESMPTIYSKVAQWSQVYPTKFSARSGHWSRS